MNPREEIASVLRRHTPTLMSVQGVVGTGEGQDRGSPAIIVFVRSVTQDICTAIPREIEGWPVVLREVGSVSAPPQGQKRR